MFRQLARAIAGLALVTVGLAAPTTVRAQTRQDGIVSQATMILDDVTARNKKGLPPLILRQAYAVAIFPDMIKAGFLIGGRKGEGVILVRGPDGSWSYPIFVDLAGGSFGLQAGIQRTDLLLVFKNRQTVDGFLQGQGKLTLGVDGSLAVGGLGRHGEMGSGVALKSQYVAYSRNRGLFLGVSVAGADLRINLDSTALYYGRAVGPRQVIMAGTSLPVPETGLTLQTLLMDKTGLTRLEVPGEVVGTVVDEPVARGVAPVPVSPPVEAVPEEMIVEPEALTPAPRPSARPAPAAQPAPSAAPASSGWPATSEPALKPAPAATPPTNPPADEPALEAPLSTRRDSDPTGIPFSKPSKQVSQRYSWTPVGYASPRSGRPMPDPDDDPPAVDSGRSGWSRPVEYVDPPMHLPDGTGASVAPSGGGWLP